MNVFATAAIVNVACVAGAVYLALNDHPWMAFFCLCCCMSAKTKKD
jgi:hypothetical protein